MLYLYNYILFRFSQNKKVHFNKVLCFKSQICQKIESDLLLIRILVINNKSDYTNSKTKRK